MAKTEGRYLKDYRRAGATPAAPPDPPPEAPAPGRSERRPASPPAVPANVSSLGPAREKAAAYHARLQPGTYFKSSGKVSPLGAFFGAVGAVALSLGWGALYGHLAFINRVPLLNLLLWLIFILFLGATGVIAAIAGHVRAPKFAGLVAALGSTAGVYLGWVVFVHGLDLKAGVDEWLFHPFPLWSRLAEMFESGRPLILNWLWLHESLWLVWIFEAVFTVILSTAVVYFGMLDSSYCEPCGLWSATKIEELRVGFPKDPAGLKARIEAWNFTAFQELGPPSISAYATLRLDVCSGCGQIGFLKIQTVREAGASDGEGAQTELLLENLMVPEIKIGELLALKAGSGS